MTKRILELAQQIRLAQSEGRSWEITEIGERKALRVRQPDSVSTSFLADDEVRALREALHRGPPTLEVSALPALTWNARTAMFEANVGGVDIFVDAPLEEGDRNPVALAAAAATYGLVMGRLTELTHGVVVQLLDVAETWGAPAGTDALAARLTLASIRLSSEAEYATEATLYFRDGGAFAGHFVEARVDRNGVVTRASLIG